MNGPSPRRLLRYVTGPLRLRRYLKAPGDRRPQPQIPARVLLWALLISRLLREPGFHAVEQLVRSSVGTAWCEATVFGDDALGYFAERLDPAVTHAAGRAGLRVVARRKSNLPELSAAVKKPFCRQPPTRV